MNFGGKSAPSPQGGLAKRRVDDLQLLAGATLTAPMISSAATVEKYVACNQYGDCWQSNRLYAYGPEAPITYYRFRSEPVEGPGAPG